MENKYYIQDKRSIIGNAMTWWVKGGCGYSSDIGNAERMNETEAIKLIESSDKYRAWPCDYIDNMQEGRFMIIDCQYPDKSKSYLSKEDKNKNKQTIQ
jgi:hypothetical protein